MSTMPRRVSQHPRWLMAPIAGLGFIATACGGLAYGAVGASPSASTPSGGGATVAVGSSSLGQILVDGSGRTLYLFKGDQGSTSTCYSSCASVWPPDTTSGPAHAGSGASTSLLSVTMRSDGQQQVTYAGHPLYYYISDTQPGQTNGQGLNQFGAGWFAVAANGEVVDHG